MELTEKELKKLQRMTDITEIQMMMASYIGYLDQMDVLLAYKRLFAVDHPDVTVEINECGGYAGPEHAKAFMERYDAYLKDKEDKRGYMDIKDLCTPYVVFSADGNRAKAQWSVFNPEAKQAMPYPGSIRQLTAIWAFGKFNCEFIRQEDGTWKFLKLRELQFVRAPYDIGWNKQPDCYRMPEELYDSPDTAPRTTFYNTDSVYSGTGLFNWGPYLPDDGTF